MTATEVFKQHLLRALSQYRGNLGGFAKAFRAGDIPKEDDPGILPLMEELKQRMRRQGVLEEDSLLLRYGLIVPGLVRGLRPPISCLIPERGGFSDKRAVQAVGQIKRLREAMKLGSLVIPVNGKDAASALLDLCELPTSSMPDEAWVELHLKLDRNEASALVQRAIECLDNSWKQVNDVGTGILTALADFRTEGLGAVLSELVKRELFWPPSMFRNAPDPVASSLVELIERSSERPDQLLLALAWTRGEVAHSAFLKWRRDGRVWGAGPFAEPERFLTDAGWCLDQDGERRELISQQCFRLSSVPGNNTVDVRCRVPEGRTCAKCAGPLAQLFNFSGVPPHFFSPAWLHHPRRITTCLDCACCGVVYTKYDPDGRAEIHCATQESGVAYRGDRVPCTLFLQLKEWPPFAAAKPFALENVSSLGGIPMWVQDPDYPACPECRKTMPFFAQFDCHSQKGEEGAYYAFFCNMCSIGAVNYQQT